MGLNTHILLCRNICNTKEKTCINMLCFMLHAQTVSTNGFIGGGGGCEDYFSRRESAPLPCPVLVVSLVKMVDLLYSFNCCVLSVMCLDSIPTTLSRTRSWDSRR